MITPPVGLNVIIASNIAESNFYRTAYEAVKIGLPLLFLPYYFIYFDIIVEVITIRILIIPLILLVHLSLLMVAIQSEKPRKTRWAFLGLSLVAIIFSYYV